MQCLTMAKFNLFESEYNLMVEATRRPAVTRKPVDPFATGVCLWFVAVFGFGYAVLGG